ncbi:uncharacterized protein MONOS_13331 [Monocercomonoides exilis]|uniref:uncharacterized protein n=1 Tax=Monocercomonoides exilis TaxID=2049356 RepID=UPI00355A46BE|nr:hypothetical protein MONOS_13331 [Monocercomonoides exilis]|eukprot:MONOS_13331.1-p1 / transcript=MONOS_13331.1 / gene=MONOS_13331 / organism=Monocercomonoides_exilis_PA203 / gene_product=unspecified product / transcript_product=unspecified product / location=Mono_scaffold00810:6148-7597(-) / protein_length=362 / sequence_SO=supercontig / SO=protein_coding / is_pseudo=false
MELFEKAIQLAEVATTKDKENDYEEALSHYSLAIDEMKSCMCKCNQGEKQQIATFIDVYISRMILIVKAISAEGGTFKREVLEGKIPGYIISTLKFKSISDSESLIMMKTPSKVNTFAPSAYGLGGDHFKTHFVEITPEKDYEPPPENSVMLVFWIIRKIRDSMDAPTWISPRIFLTPSIWESSDYSIPSFMDKENFVLASNEAFQAPSHINPSRILTYFICKQALDDLIDRLEKAQSTLAKNLSCISDPLPQKQSSNVVKSFFGSIASKMKHAAASSTLTHAEYITHLKLLLDNALSMQLWYVFFSGFGTAGRPLCARIERVVESLKTSLLEFLIRDIGAMVETEMLNGRKNFSRLFKGK